jgi:poly(A) polymerase
MSDTTLAEVTRGWLADPAVAAVFDALETAGGSARFVGGCVRDALRGRSVADIDIAVDLEPPDVIAALETAGLRAVPTGIDHGTVTAVAASRGLEVTSLRRDVETDGRRAVVAYTKDWRADSERRDFTVNALYADRAGDILDFHGGVDDLREGRLRFIGDPILRIREDILRILRFFRFMAQLDVAAPDPEGLAACRDQVALLPRLSAERVAPEVLRLLDQAKPLPALGAMRDAGATAHWLPEARNDAALAALIDLEAMRGEGDPIRRLAVLCDGAAAGVGARLKLSSAAQARLAALDGEAAAPDRARAAVYRLGPAGAVDRALVGLARGRDGWRDVLDTADRWTPPRFPLTGADVLARGVPPGPAVGAALDDLEAAWIAADFAWDRNALLSRLEARIEQERS